VHNPTNPTEIQPGAEACGINKRYYPLMLDVQDKPCLVVGGGPVAERKVQGLLEAEARVTVISPAFTERLVQLEQEGRLTLLREPYRSGLPELAAAVLVFAATDKPQVNAAVRLDAQALGKLVNSADDADGSGFIVPAVVRRGRLLLTVSTSGASPAVARKVKRELETTFGGEYEIYLDLLQELRDWVQLRVPAAGERQEMFRLMLDWPLLEWIRGGAFDKRQAECELLARLASDPSAAGAASAGVWIKEQVSSLGL